MTCESARVLFADFEAFQHGAESFRIKELCFLAVDEPMRPLYFIFKAPCAWEHLTDGQRRTYAYEEKHIHGLAWAEGYTRYCTNCISHHIDQAFSVSQVNTIIYVFGRQKLEFLKAEFPHLKLIHYDFIDSFKELLHAPSHITCPYRVHGEREHCAMLKCYRLLSHYLSV